MLAFTNSRRIVRLRKALENLTLIGMNDILIEWVRQEENAMIAEAVAIERRNTNRGHNLTGDCHARRNTGIEGIGRVYS